MNAATIDELGLHPDRWQAVVQLAGELTASKTVPALAIGLSRGGRWLPPLAFGRRRLADPDSKLKPTDRFVVASLTKPVVAMGLLRLVEQGRLSLNDRVSDVIPEYDAAPKRATTLRHLLTHTSGLPDMLPNNLSLRQSHAPLLRFVEGACGVALDFPPGRGVQYQSLGYALLGEVIARVSGRSCPEFLRQELFEPLGMSATRLGAGEQDAASFPDDLAEIRVPAEMTGGDDWNWNSGYWRRLGAPWGGLVSTAGDLSRFCAMMLQRGELNGARVLAPATIQAAISNQLEAFHDVPEADRRTRGWGLGWRHNWLTHAASFGDFLSPSAVGHWGATGTLFWVDPSSNLAAVILSTQPLDRERSVLIRLSNLIVSSLTGRNGLM